MIYELDINDKSAVKKVNNFLSSQSNADYMQEIDWTNVRYEEKCCFLYYILNDEIVWTCSLMEKNKNGEKYIYAPRGPVLKDNDFRLIEVFLRSIEKWINNKEYKKLVINPYIYNDNLNMIPKKYEYKIIGRTDYANLHESCKLAIMDIIFDEEKLINMLPSKFRQNTRRSYRKGLTNKVSKKVDLDSFYELYLQTAERHDFKPHTKEYFKNLINVYKDKLIFLEVWYKDIPLAMSIDIIHHNKLIYLYGVSSTDNRNLLGMYNLQWEAIKYCIANKIPKYDFGGVFCEENDFDNKDYGLYSFKKGYCYNGFIDIVPDLVFTFKEG